jgi:hypothetical protein
MGERKIRMALFSKAVYESSRSTLEKPYAYRSEITHCTEPQELWSRAGPHVGR